MEPESMRIRLGSILSCSSMPSTTLFREACEPDRKSARESVVKYNIVQYRVERSTM
jgi:hypothetical protein